MKKRLISVFVCVIFLFATPVYATTDPVQNDAVDNVSVMRMTYISSASANLNISTSGMATIESSIIGVTSVTSVKIVATIQRYSSGVWTPLQSWTETATGRTHTLSENRVVTSGYTYRVVSKVTAYSGSSSETATVTSGQVTY